MLLVGFLQLRDKFYLVYLGPLPLEGRQEAADIGVLIYLCEYLPRGPPGAWGTRGMPGAIIPGRVYPGIPVGIPDEVYVGNWGPIGG